MVRPRWEVPIRARKSFKLTYADSGFGIALSSGYSYAGSYFFRGNAPYDPDYTGVGVQPYGYDQLCPGLYNKYRCAGSAIKIHFNIPQSATDIKVFIIPSRSNGVSWTDASDLRQVPKSKQIVINGQLGSMRGHNIKHYCSTRAIFSELGPKDDTLSSIYNNVPNAQWYWLVYLDTSSQTQTVIVTFDVEIKYYTILEMTESVNES